MEGAPGWSGAPNTPDWTTGAPRALTMESTVVLQQAILGKTHLCTKFRRRLGPSHRAPLPRLPPGAHAAVGVGWRLLLASGAAGVAACQRHHGAPGSRGAAGPPDGGRQRRQVPARAAACCSRPRELRRGRHGSWGQAAAPGRARALAFTSGRACGRSLSAAYDAA